MPAIACTATRAILLSGCCSVRSTPEVWAWNLKRHEAGSLAPSRSRASRAQMRRAGAEFGDLLEEADRYVEEESETPQHDIDVHAAIDAVLRILERGRDGEGHGLDRRRAGLLHVLTDDRHRIPARHVPAAELDMVEQDAPRAGQRQPVEHVIGDEMRDVVALVRGAGDRRPRNAAPLGDGEREGEQRERRRIVHRGGDVAERHAVERPVHVIGGVDHGAAGAEQNRIDLVAVHAAKAGIARQEADRGGAGVENDAHALVVVFGRAQADQLALRPGAAAVHGRIDAAGEGVLAGKAEGLEKALAVPVARRVQRLDLDLRAVPDRALGADLPPILGAPAAVRLLEPGKRELNGFLAHWAISPSSASFISRTLAASAATCSMISSRALPGPKIAFTPAAMSAGRSSSGTMPPTTTPT